MSLFRCKNLLLCMLSILFICSSYAQTQLIDRYALCIATMNSINALDETPNSDLSARIKRKQNDAFEYIKKQSQNLSDFDSNYKYFSTSFEQHMDFYAQVAKMGGASLVVQAIRNNMKSCE